MHTWQKLSIATGAFLVLAAAPSFAAQPPDRGDTPGLGWGGGGSTKGAPGPIAGAGLPFLLIAGGYIIARMRRNRGAGES